jgi:hypothetical protein
MQRFDKVWNVNAVEGVGRNQLMLQRRLIKVFGLLAALLFASDALAGTTTALSMLLSFGDSIPGLWILAQAITYIVALALFGIAMYKLKRIAERKSQEGVASVALMLLAATGMLYLASSIDTFMVSLFSSTSILEYTSSSILDAQGIQAARVVIGFVNLIGLIAFARGLYGLKLIGEGRGNRENTAQRSIVLLVGGTLCLNIVSFAQILQNTLGITNIIH